MHWDTCSTANLYLTWKPPPNSDNLSIMITLSRSHFEVLVDKRPLNNDHLWTMAVHYFWVPRVVIVKYQFFVDCKNFQQMQELSYLLNKNYYSQVFLLSIFLSWSHKDHFILLLKSFFSKLLKTENAVQITTSQILLLLYCKIIQYDES